MLSPVELLEILIKIFICKSKVKSIDSRYHKFTTILFTKKGLPCFVQCIYMMMSSILDVLT